MSLAQNQSDISAKPADRNRAQWIRATAIGLGMALVSGIFAVAFLWPLSTSQPDGIGLAVSGPDQVVISIIANVDTQQPGLFTIESFQDRDQVVSAIAQRSVAGGISVGPDGIEVLTASAGGPQVAQLLTQVASGMSAQAAAQSGPHVTITDVVPAGDMAAAANLTIFPALIAGLSGGIVGLLLVRRPIMRVATLFTSALGAGLAGSAVLGPWFGVLAGNYWLQSLGIGIGALAIGATVMGLGTILGRAGMGLAAVLLVLFGNPWGGTLVPTEFLQSPWGTIGSYLPNGTIIQLMRSISFFPDASTAGRWWTLVVWAAAGISLLILGAIRHEKVATQP